MSDDSKHLPEDELFNIDTPEDDISTDGDSTDSEDNSDEDELSNQDLPRLEAQKKFAKSWADKIASGETSLEELKAKQPWLVPSVNELLKNNSPKNFDHEEIARIAREEAIKAFAAEQEKKAKDADNVAFNDLKRELDESATKDQKKVINSEWKELMAEGVSPLKALKLAAKVAGVVDDYREQRNRYPSMQSGATSRGQEFDWAKVDPNKMSLEDAKKHLGR